MTEFERGYEQGYKDGLATQIGEKIAPLIGQLLTSINEIIAEMQIQETGRFIQFTDKEKYEWFKAKGKDFDGKCSLCGSMMFKYDKYCGMCGARMMKEDNDEH